MRGSKHNDMFVPTPDGSNTGGASGSSSTPAHAVPLRTLTNRSGGIQGGITNGEPIVFRVAFKPPATIGVAQTTVDFDGKPSVLRAEGRHDPCVVPRAVPIVEAMAALVLADAAMLQLAREAAASHYPVQGKVQPPQPPKQEVEALQATQLQADR
jgi:chorismate synthase